MNPEFSRAIGRLTVTSTWNALSFEERTALVSDVEQAERVADLTPSHQDIIRRAERDLSRTASKSRWRGVLRIVLPRRPASSL